uniref:phospholipase D n=1 Tax=Achlya hypogyna TaxID=1202772 RepID=A0A0A7CMX4_ACHHY|nr:secreted protein [Achlya hypogyna]
MVNIHTSLPLLALAAVVHGAVTCVRDPSIKNAVSKWCMCQPCHLCEFSPLKGGCQPIVTSATSLSDGRDVPTKQPVLDSAAWFLSEAELTRSRGGVPRASLATFTTGNLVDIFPDTSSAFIAMHNDVTIAEAAYFTSWTVHNLQYMPRVDPLITFKTTWGNAITKHNLKVRGLVWENLVELGNVTDIYAWINSLNSDEVQVMADDRTPAVTGSLHQKTLTLTQGKRLWSYVGGLDPALNRWDTKYHNETQLRAAAHVDVGSHGWVDVHARIDGPGAIDIFGNFADRWNDPVHPGQPWGPPVVNPPVPLQRDWNVPRDVIAPASVLAPVAVDRAGPHDVQVLRTFSCKYGGYANFAPKGESSILAGRIKAIRNAKNYIYIEDQYFVHVPELMTELLKVLPVIQRLIIFTVTPEGSEAAVGYQKYQFDMIAPLLEKFPNKVQIYVTDPARSIYVHSKSMIIDDVYVSVGSSNWNVRSMTSDAEIGANIVDTTHVADGSIMVAKHARDYRIAKFSELIGFSVDITNMSFLDTADALEKYAQKDGAWIQPYLIYEKPFWVVFTDLHKNIIDGDGRCSNAKLEDGELDTSCNNSEWLQGQARITQVTCACHLQGLTIYNCRDMDDYMANEQVAFETSMTW